MKTDAQPGFPAAFQAGEFRAGWEESGGGQELSVRWPKTGLRYVNMSAKNESCVGQDPTLRDGVPWETSK